MCAHSHTGQKIRATGAVLIWEGKIRTSRIYWSTFKTCFKFNLVGTGASHQAWQPEFDPPNARQKLMPANCPLTPHTCITHTNKKLNVNLKNLTAIKWWHTIWMRVGSFSLELTRVQAFPHVTVHNSAHYIVSLPYSFTSLVFIKITKGLFILEK